MDTAMIKRTMPPAMESAPGEKVQEPREQLTERNQDDCDHTGSREHFAGHSTLCRVVHARRHLHERHERDLRSDPNEQQQERVDYERDINGLVRHLQILHIPFEGAGCHTADR
jgi:hypothetical protein